MHPKILNVKTKEPYCLIIEFDNNEVKLYDLTSFAYFTEIKNLGLLNNYTIDPGGYGLSFSDDIDVSEYELYTKSIPY